MADIDINVASALGYFELVYVCVIVKTAAAVALRGVVCLFVRNI
jgi:hypothetical protein